MESTLVNACFLLVGAQAVTRPGDVGDGGEVDVWMDGWIARLDAQTVAEASHLRGEVERSVAAGFVGDREKVAALLDADLTEWLAEFLISGCGPAKGRGWRTPRTPQRDRCSVCVRSFPPNTTAMDLEACFSAFGRVVDVRIAQGGDHVANAMAWVRLGTREGAVSAVNQPPFFGHDVQAEEAHLSEGNCTSKNCPGLGGRFGASWVVRPCEAQE